MEIAFEGKCVRSAHLICTAALRAVIFRMSSAHRIAAAIGSGDSMSVDHWYYAQGGRASGPVRIATLRAMAASGDVFSTDMFWREGLPDWTPGHQVKELFPEPPSSADRPTPGQLPYATPSAF